jgi:CMP/dCMP kinase
VVSSGSPEYNHITPHKDYYQKIFIWIKTPDFMIITISGLAGSGKTTIGKRLAEKLGYEFYDIGTLRKKMALDHGMTIEEFNRLGEKKSFTDKDADAFTIKLAKTEDNFVMQGRLAYHFIPKSVKIFIIVSPDKAARRIMKDKDNPERNSKSKNATLEEIKRLCIERDHSDVLRYKKIYGIENFTDKANYDFILDTTDEDNVEFNVNRIISFLKEKNLVKQNL